MRLLRTIVTVTVSLALFSACTTQVDETCGGRGAATGTSLVNAKKDPNAPLTVQRAQAAIVCDADAIATRVSEYAGSNKAAATERLRELTQAALDDLSARPPESSRFPASAVHEQMYALAAEVERVRDATPMIVWRANPWHPLTPLDRSDSRDGPLTVAAMRGEHRAVAMNVRSVAMTSRTLQVAVTIPQFPAEAVQIHRANWTGTKGSDWTAAELERLGEGNITQSLMLSPGITQQIWIRVSPPRPLAPGHYAGRIDLSLEGELPVQVPIEIEVFKTQFPEQPSLHFGGWDYSDQPSPGYALTELNRAVFIEHLQSRHVDTPWAHNGVLNWQNIDSDGRQTASLDSSLLAEWLARWPKARRFRVYVEAGDVATVNVPQEQFARAIGGWAQAWAGEIRRLGRSPEQFDLLIVDEPKTPAQVQTTVFWAKAIKDAGAGFRIWTDANADHPARIPQELLDAADTIAIYMGSAERAGQAYWDWSRQLAATRGKSVEIYTYDGPADSLDPYRYYRLIAWRTALAGVSGVTFWSFADTGGSPSDNQFAAEKVNYAPLFVNAATVNAGKHMEAAAEGMQDTEYLRMLQQLTSHADDGVRAQSQQLLGEVADFLSRSGPSSKSKWNSQRECEEADGLRIRIGRLLDATVP
jgi:hypothetical protein